MEIFLIIVCVVFSLLTLLGFIANSKLQENGGYMYLGGINGGRAEKYLKSTPTAKSVYDQLEIHGHTFWHDNDIDKLIQAGAGAVFTSKDSNDIIVVTPKTIIAYGDTGSYSAGADGQIYSDTKGLELFQYDLFKREVVNNIVGSYQTTTPAKEKSVIGNAVAGAVIAGGVGAVVGAINAANHNAKAKDTVKTHYVYGTDILDHYYMFHYHLANNCFEIDKMYFSNDIIKSQTDYDYYKMYPMYGVKEAFNLESNS